MRKQKYWIGLIIVSGLMVGVLGAAEAAWKSGYSYRKQITIDYTKVSGSSELTNFPILINITDDDLRTTANGGYVTDANGYDIVFTDSDGATELDHEIEKYTASAGELIAWVRIPTLKYNEDTIIYVYYGNSNISSSQENIIGVWDSNYKMVQHLQEEPLGPAPQMLNSTSSDQDGTSYGKMTCTDQVSGKINGSLDFDGVDDYIKFTYNATGDLWTKSGNNPMIDGAFGSMWYNGANDYQAYYGDGINILHATSSDGQNWTVDDANNPVLTGTAGEWDANHLYASMVWKEDSTWYILYRGRNNGERHIGLATSSDGLNWTKDPNNPVLSATPGTWDASGGLGLDPWGIMKIDSTYYLWYNTVNSSTSTTRATGLATSTDLVNWTKDANNPIFENGRFCIHPFKYGSYYYMLVPYYDRDYCYIELYRDTNPTFYSDEREFLGRILVNGDSGEWDSRYFDTPSVLTNDIYRNSFPDDNIWMYYTGLDDSYHWKEGLAEYPLANLAGLTPISEDDSLDITDAVTLEAWVKLDSSSSTCPVIIDKTYAYGLTLHKVSSKFYTIMELKTDLPWRFTSDADSEVTTGDWHYIAATYDSTTNTVSYYLNGQPDGTDTTNGQGQISTSASSLGLQHFSGNYNFDGGIDEVRVSSVARSAEWVESCFNNQKYPDKADHGADGFFEVETTNIQPLITPEGDKTVGTTPTVTGTAPNASSTVTIKDKDGTTVATTTTDSSGKYRVEVSTLATGSNSLTPYVGGLAGVASSLTVDSANDEAPTITSPTEGEEIRCHRGRRSYTPTITGKGSANQFVEITALDSSGNLTTVGTGTVDADGNYSVTCTTALPPGPNSISVTINGVTSSIIDVALVNPKKPRGRFILM